MFKKTIFVTLVTIAACSSNETETVDIYGYEYDESKTCLYMDTKQLIETINITTNSPGQPISGTFYTKDKKHVVNAGQDTFGHISSSENYIVCEGNCSYFTIPPCNNTAE